MCTGFLTLQSRIRLCLYHSICEVYAVQFPVEVDISLQSISWYSHPLPSRKNISGTQAANQAIRFQPQVPAPNSSATMPRCRNLSDVNRGTRLTAALRLSVHKVGFGFVWEIACLEPQLSECHTNHKQPQDVVRLVMPLPKYPTASQLNDPHCV